MWIFYCDTRDLKLHQLEVDIFNGNDNLIFFLLVETAKTSLFGADSSMEFVGPLYANWIVVRCAEYQCKMRLQRGKPIHCSIKRSPLFVSAATPTHESRQRKNYNWTRPWAFSKRKCISIEFNLRMTIYWPIYWWKNVIKLLMWYFKVVVWMKWGTQ